jgi:hypothetical protein
MRRFTFFFIISLFITTATYGQDDYVISKPINNHTPKSFAQIANPDYTNYFLTPTAFTLKSRDIRLSGTDIIFAKGSYGITNTTTASVNISLIGTVTGVLKQRIELSEDISIAGTISFGQVAAIDEDSIIYIGGGSVVGTYGDIQNNFSIGTGFYYVRSTFILFNEETDLPLYNIFIGGQRQIGRKTYLMFDGIYFPDYRFYTGAIGIKVVIKSSMSLSFGLMPVAFDDVRGSRNSFDGGILPVVTFRMLLDRHIED